MSTSIYELILLVFGLVSNAALATNSSSVFNLSGRAESVSWYHSNASVSKVLNIGTAITLDASTKYGTMGKVVRQAYTLYFDWLNRNRGGLTVGGEKYWVNLHLLDDRSDGDRAENITRHLLTAKNITHFLGPYGSTLTQRAASVLNETNAVMVCGCAASTSVFKDRPRMFGVLSTTSQFLIHAFDQLKLFSVDSVAYMYEDLAFTAGVCGQVDTLANDRNIRVVFGNNNEGRFTHDPNGTMVSTLLTIMKMRQPEALVGCVYADVCKAILDKAAALQFNPKAIVFTICVTTPDYRTVNGDNGGFVMGVTPWTRELQATSKLTGLDVNNFVQLYEATYGDRVVYQAAASFAAASSLAYAIEKAGTVTNPDKVANVLRSMDNDTVFGRVAFDVNGQGMNPIKVVQAQGNATPVIGPQASATANLVYPKPTFNALSCLNSDATNVGRHGIYPNGSCLLCNSTETAPFNTTLGYRVCKKLICPSGHTSVITFNGAWCAACWAGYYAAASGATQCQTCALGKHNYLSGADACTECTPGRFANSQAQISCANCGPGSYSSSSGRSRCDPCPTGSFCNIGANGLRTDYINDDGYFLFNQGGGAASLIKCQHGKDGSACVRGGKCYEVNGQETMEGPFCGKCREGYGRSKADDVCKECPSMFRRLGLVFFLVLYPMTVAFVVFALVLRTDLTKPNKLVSVIIKQVINHLSMSGVVWQATTFRFPLLNTGIAENVMEFLRVGLGASSPDFTLTAGHCLAADFLTPHKAYVLLSLVWVPALTIFLSCAFMLFRRVQWSRGVKVPRARLITLLIVNLFVVHPRNTDLSLSVFRCKLFDKPRLLMDTTVDCKAMSHRIWQCLGLLSFCLYSLGIPFGVFVTLRRYKKKGKLHKRKVINTLGFLYSGYEPQFYYFESVLMLRKILFKLVIDIPQFAAKSENHDNAIRCMSLMLLAVFFLAMHMTYEPYDNRSYFALDRIEASSLWAIVLTLLVQAWLLLSDEAYVFNVADNGDIDGTRLNKDIRDSIGALIVIYCHVRFFCLLLFISVRPFILQVTQWNIFNHGAVEVEGGAFPQGLRVVGADRMGMTLFTSILQELSSLLVEVRDKLGYDELVSSLQFLCVNSAYHRKRDKIEQGMLDEDDDADDLQKSVMDTFKSRRTLAKMGSRFAGVLHHQVFNEVKQRVNRQTRIVCEAIGSEARITHHTTTGSDWRDASTPQQLKIIADLERLKHFSADAVEMCTGERFFIDELHMAVVRLSRDVNRLQHVNPRHTPPNGEVVMPAAKPAGMMGTVVSNSLAARPAMNIEIRRSMEGDEVGSMFSEPSVPRSHDASPGRMRRLFGRSCDESVASSTMSRSSSMFRFEVSRPDDEHEASPPDVEDIHMLRRELRDVKAQFARLKERHHQIKYEHSMDVQESETRRLQLVQQIRSSMNRKLLSMKGAMPSLESSSVLNECGSSQHLSLPVESSPSSSSSNTVRSGTVGDEVDRPKLQHSDSAGDEVDSPELQHADSCTVGDVSVTKEAFVIGDRVERRDKGREWQPGYVTSVAPLKVTLADDPLDKTGYIWKEVRPVGKKEGTKILAKPASGARKRSPLDADCDWCKCAESTAPRQEAPELQQLHDSPAKLESNLELKLRNEELEDKQYTLKLEIERAANTIQQKDIALEQSKVTIAKLQAEVQRLVALKGAGPKYAQVLGRQQPATPRTPRR